MSSNKKWHFSDAGAGPYDGFNSPAIDHFRADNSIFREVIQNSLDNANENTSDPVYVKFERRDYPSTAFGINNSLINIFNHAYHWTENADKKDIKLFYDNALKLLSKKSLDTFVVSDFNTNGLFKFPHDEKSNFFRLILNPGASKNSGDGGGSHGHGQHAAYARSYLRTVFYQSFVEKNIEQTNHKRLYVGKTILNAWKTKNDIRRGTGYYISDVQNNKIIPFYDNEVPPTIRGLRDKNGTDIIILAPRLGIHWYRGATASVVDNFFAAIEEEKLQVEIVKKNDSTIISKENIDQVIKGTQNLISKNYLDALRQTNNDLIFSKKIKDFGEIILKVAFHERGNQRVVVLRKPRMKLKEYKKTILPNFSAVLLVDDDRGNEVLRNIEDSEHKDFEISRENELYPNKNFLKQIEDFIDDTLLNLNKARVDDEIIIPGLGDFLPSQDDSKKDGSDDSDSNEMNTASEAQQMEIEFNGQVTLYKPSVSNIAVIGGTGGKGSGGGYRKKVTTKGGGGTGGTSGGEDTGDGVSILNSIDTRIFINNKMGDEFSYVCRITCKEDCDGYFGVSAIGSDAVNIKPNIKKASYLDGKRGDLKILESSKIVVGELKKGDKISLVLETDLSMPAALIGA